MIVVLVPGDRSLNNFVCSRLVSVVLDRCSVRPSGSLEVINEASGSKQGDRVASAAG